MSEPKKLKLTPISDFSQELLFNAVKRNDASAIGTMYRNRVNFGGALHVAAEYASADTVLHLLDLGVGIEERDNNGRTPLHLSHPFNIETLLRRKADVHARDSNEKTPLHTAASEGKTDSIEPLVRYGAVLDVVDRFNESPLSDASRKGHTYTVKELIKRGATTRGIKIRDEHLIYITGTDVHLTTQSVEDHLMQNSKNFVLLDEFNVPIMANVDTLQDYMKDAIVFACMTNDGTFGPRNVDNTVELYNTQKLGYVHGGYINNSSLREAMRLTVQQNKRLFRFSRSEREVPSVVSQQIYEFSSNTTSGSHCQPGRNGDVRSLFVINVSNIPNIPPSDEQINNDNLQDVKFVRYCITILVHSSEHNETAKMFSPQITDAWYSLPSRRRKNSIALSDINDGILDLITASADDLLFLSKLCRTFYPSIHSIGLSQTAEQESPILPYIKGLKKFHGLNVHQPIILRSLIKHAGTLEEIILNGFHRLHQSSFSNLTSLKKLKLASFGNFDDVFQSLRYTPGTLRKLSLDSSTFNGSLNGLQECIQLEHLVMKLRVFTQALNPISSLINLRVIYLFLPVFVRNFNPLSDCTELTDITTISISNHEVDTSRLTALNFSYRRRVLVKNQMPAVPPLPEPLLPGFWDPPLPEPLLPGFWDP